MAEKKEAPIGATESLKKDRPQYEDERWTVAHNLGVDDVKTWENLKSDFDSVVEVAAQGDEKEIMRFKELLAKTEKRLQEEWKKWGMLESIIKSVEERMENFKKYKEYITKKIERLRTGEKTFPQWEAKNFLSELFDDDNDLIMGEGAMYSDKNPIPVMTVLSLQQKRDIIKEVTQAMQFTKEEGEKLIAAMPLDS